MQLTEADIDINVLVFESYDGNLGVGSGGKVFDFRATKQLLCKLIEEMGLSLYEIGTNANEIDITTVGTQVKYVTSEG